MLAPAIAGFYGVYSVYNVNLEIGKLEVPANSLIMYHVVTINDLGNTNYQALGIPASTGGRRHSIPP